MRLVRLLRLLLCVCVCLYALSLNLFTVSATEIDGNKSYFNGIEYPLTSGNTMLLTDIEGYNFSWFHQNSNGWAWTETKLGYEVPKGSQNYGIQIKLPETIQRNDTFDIALTITTDLRNFSNAYITLIDNTSAACGSSDVSIVNNGSGKYTFKATDVMSSTANVRHIRIQFTCNNSAALTPTITCNSIDVTVVDNTKGLLNGIIEWIQGIFEGITDLPANIANSIRSFFTWIVNAVDNMKNAVVNALSSLGSFIIDGIKGLFVPEEDYINIYKTKWDTLLEDRMGAIYQSVSIISEFFNTIKNNNLNGYAIEVPAITLHFGTTDMVVGGWVVDLVPEGFTFILSFIKTITNIVCTFAVFNTLKNRYYKLVGDD